MTDTWRAVIVLTDVYRRPTQKGTAEEEAPV